MARTELKAVIHCTERIPCNPCETACPFGAIRVGEDITALPVLEATRCRGCGICVAVCPGLAVQLVDEGYSAETALVGFAWEYLPLPGPGQRVALADAEGRTVGQGEIRRVQQPLPGDPTRVLYAEVPREIAGVVQGLARPGAPAGPVPAAWEGETAEDPVVCRCEEVPLSVLRAAIARGETTRDGIKRRTRAGMGFCQGKTCGRLVDRLLSEAAGIPPGDQEPGRRRPPVEPVTLGEIASGSRCFGTEDPGGE